MRTAKRLCVAGVTGLLLACFVVIFTQCIYCARSVQISVDLLHRRSVSRKLKFGGHFFSKKIIITFFPSSYFRTEGIATVYFKLLKCFPLLALSFCRITNSCSLSGPHEHLSLSRHTVAHSKTGSFRIDSRVGLIGGICQVFLWRFRSVCSRCQFRFCVSFVL